jgi:hypothetical protein
MPKKISLTLVASLFVLSAYFVACRDSDTSRKAFTEAEVAEIQSLLKGLDPADYRVVLPVFRDNKIVSSETHGTLPITEVRRVASTKNINYVETGNVQAIFASDGKGAGSHTPSDTAAKGRDIGIRIERILANLDKSQYVLIY